MFKAGQGEDGGAIGGAVGGALLGLAGVGVGVGIAAYCIWKNRWCKGMFLRCVCTIVETTVLILACNNKKKPTPLLPPHDV